MAPKRLKKSCTNADNGKKYQNLSISDALCPICRSIIIEPVTLPCNHSFCLACFDGTVENTTLTCPLCRTRIGSWLRSARKEKRVVNTLFWTNVQIKFPNEIQKRMNGEDTIVEEDDINVSIKLADPGEIRREYEIQLEREKSVIQKERDTEAKASEIVIKKILEEEQEAARLEEEKLRLDEEVAKRLAAENSQVVVQKQSNKQAKSNAKKSSIDKYLIALSKKKQQQVTESKACSSSSNSNESTPAAKKPVKNYTSTIMCQSRPNQKTNKPLQHLLLAKTLQCERANSNGSDSGDSIKQEMRYFKPIRLAPSIDKYQNGQIVHIPLLKLPTIHAKTNASAVIRSPQINQTTLITTHPKSAFVSLSTNVQQQPSINDSDRRVLKQYYNRKRNTLSAAKQPCTITSTSESPLLGFEVVQNDTKHVTIIKDFIKKLTQNMNGNGCAAQPLSIPITIPIQIPIPITPITPITISTKVVCDKNESFNGFKPRKNELNIQEQLDLEFAKRLHEELNNPRQTRASLINNSNISKNSKNIKKTPSKTRSSPRKRQVTLEELITPKKFKI